MEKRIIALLAISIMGQICFAGEYSVKLKDASYKEAIVSTLNEWYQKGYIGAALTIATVGHLLYVLGPNILSDQQYPIYKPIFIPSVLVAIFNSWQDNKRDKEDGIKRDRYNRDFIGSVGMGMLAGSIGHICLAVKSAVLASHGTMPTPTTIHTLAGIGVVYTTVIRFGANFLSDIYFGL